MQKALKRERFLWQLFNIENDIEKATEDVDAEKSNRKDVMRELEKFEKEAGKRKVEQAKYLKEIAQREKKIAERSSKLGKIVSIPWKSVVNRFYFPAQIQHFQTSLTIYCFVILWNLTNFLT